MTTQAIQHQIELAKHAIIKYGYSTPAVITEVKRSPRARKSFYGFHFEEGRSVGETGINDDGSLYKIVAIVNA